MTNNLDLCYTAVSNGLLEDLRIHWPSFIAEMIEEEESNILCYAIRQFTNDQTENRKAIVMYLLDNNAEINIPDDTMSYPIHAACEKSLDYDIIAKIIERIVEALNGQERTQFDSNGNTAIYYAMHFDDQNDAVRLISLLADAGIRSVDQDNNGTLLEFYQELLLPEYQFPPVAKLLGEIDMGIYPY